MLYVCVVRVCGLVACVCIRVYVRAYMFARTDECALLAPIYFAGALCSMRMYIMLTPRHALAYHSSYDDADEREKKKEEVERRF